MLSPAVTTPAQPTPPEQIAEALLHIGPLQGLPLEDRLWLAQHGQEVAANAGDVLFEEGAPVAHMILILKGEIHVRRQHGGPMALFIGRAGQMTGVLPFSRMKTYGGQGFAISPVWALLIPKPSSEMLQAIPSMTQRVVSTLLDRVREVTRIEQQAEKLTALGKLAGNLAHELNNPASAAQSAAASLARALSANRANRFKLVNLCLTKSRFAAFNPGKRRSSTAPSRSQSAERARNASPSSPARNPSAPGSPKLAAPTHGRSPPVGRAGRLRRRSRPHCNSSAASTKPASPSSSLPATSAPRAPSKRWPTPPPASSISSSHQGLLRHGPRPHPRSRCSRRP
jgi:CRP-like cAMP-binding protein